VARELGRADIAAIIYVVGQPPGAARLLLEQLHSPKSSILEDVRYLVDNLWPAQKGSSPPPIEVEPLGKPGQGQTTPLRDVVLEP